MVTKRKRSEDKQFLLLLSPAKLMNEERPDPKLKAKQSKRRFEAETFELVSECRKKSVAQLRKLMGLSEALGKLNKQRFKDFHGNGTGDPKNLKKAALWLFKGQAYQALDVASLSPAQHAVLQSRLRIISGLYGLLRPMDAIQPYRLMMGTKLENSKGKNLYAFWGAKIAEAIKVDLKNKEHGVILNVASNEYFKAVDRTALAGWKVVNLEFRDGGKIVSVYAKKARGLFVRYFAINNPSTLDEVKNFNLGLYKYQARLSGPDKLVFTRTAEDAAQYASSRVKPSSKKATKKKKK